MAFQFGKVAESCQSGDGRKKNCFPVWKTSRKPSASLQMLSRGHCPPLSNPEVFPQGLSQGLLSTKHNTNVCFVRPQFRVPLFISVRIHMSPPLFVCSLYLLVVSIFFTPCPFPPFWRVMLVNLTSHIRFGLWRQRLRAQGQPWGHLCKYVSNCHTAAEQCVVFSQSALPYWRQSFERNYSDFIFVSVVTKH